MSTDHSEENTSMIDLEAKVRRLETQLSQANCELILMKQQLCSAEQQIATHKDYKVKLEQVLSNMQEQHELIVNKLTLAGQPVGTKLLSQNERTHELQELFESDSRTYTQLQYLTINEEKVDQDIKPEHQDIPKIVQVTAEPEAFQSPNQCQGDSENQIQPVLLMNGHDCYHSHNEHRSYSPSPEVVSPEQATEDVESSVYLSAAVSVHYGSASVHTMPGKESIQLLKDKDMVRESNNSHTT